jgi:putative ABC transport system substrate-binding protein
LLSRRTYVGRKSPVKLRKANYRFSIGEKLGLAGLRDKGAQAIFLISDPRFSRKHVSELTTASGLPTICQERDWADGGCVVTYGADNLSMFRQSASYVDRILKGTRPAELPIGLAPRFELVINAGSAKAIGLTIPSSVLKRADAVVP